MELAFVFSALRRRFWVVTLMALLGSIPGLTADPPTGDTYRSQAVLLVQPPTRATGIVFSSAPDRYVVSQLSVLESASLAQKVARRVSAQLGTEFSAEAATVLTEITHEPGTDIVQITAEGNSADLAATLAQAYAELYVEGLETTDEDQQQRADLEREIETLSNQLEAQDMRLEQAMEEFLPRDGDPTPDPIPPAEFVDPSAVSQRTLILVELQQLQASLNELDQQSRLRVNTEIISDAVVPAEPIPPSGNFLLAGGLIGGILGGVVLTLLWARFSTKVLDEDAAGEILGTPVVAELAHYRSLRRNPMGAFQSLPRSAAPVVDQLCVRAEALGRIGEPLTVIVTGTMRSAGSTTLALAMSERFAAGGAAVVLVDGDVHDPRVTTLFNGGTDGGVPAIIANGGSLTDQRGRSALTRTMDPAVSVLGLGPNRAAANLRRDTVPNVLDAARRNADIVVIDGGPVLDLASTLQFANLADAVVLAVPLSRQKADALTDLARQLDSVRSKLLLVITAPARRAAKGQIYRSEGGTDGRMPMSSRQGGAGDGGMVVPDGANGHLVATAAPGPAASGPVDYTATVATTVVTEAGPAGAQTSTVAPSSEAAAPANGAGSGGAHSASTPASSPASSPVSDVDSQETVIAHPPPPPGAPTP